MTGRPVTYSLLILMAIGTFAVSANIASGIATFHVAPNGNDSWSSRQSKPDADRTDGPLATLAAGCAAARQLGTEASQRIVLQAGEYFFDEPVVLTEEDSGLTIEAATGADVTLYGGRKVTGWYKDGPNFYAAALPGVREGDWDFRALIVNDSDLRLTWPKSSDYRFEKNVLLAGGRIVFENREAITTLAGNVLYSAIGEVECRKLDQYSQTGKYAMQADAANVLVDPKLIAYRDGRVETASDSPVRAIGIDPIDVSNVEPRRWCPLPCGVGLGLDGTQRLCYESTTIIAMYRVGADSWKKKGVRSNRNRHRLRQTQGRMQKPARRPRRPGTLGTWRCCATFWARSASSPPC